MLPPPPRSTLFPYTTLFRSAIRGTATEYLGKRLPRVVVVGAPVRQRVANVRSEEHTSELQSHSDLVCRLLLEKKKKVVLYTTAGTRLAGRALAQDTGGLLRG